MIFARRAAAGDRRSIARSDTAARCPTASPCPGRAGGARAVRSDWWQARRCDAAGTGRRADGSIASRSPSRSRPASRRCVPFAEYNRTPSPTRSDAIDRRALENRRHASCRRRRSIRRRPAADSTARCRWCGSRRRRECRWRAAARPSRATCLRARPYGAACNSRCSSRARSVVERVIQRIALAQIAADLQLRIVVDEIARRILAERPDAPRVATSVSIAERLEIVVGLLKQQRGARRRAALPNPSRLDDRDADARSGKRFGDHRAGHAAADDRDLGLVVPAKDWIPCGRFRSSQPNCPASPQHGLAHRYSSCTTRCQGQCRSRSKVVVAVSRSVLARASRRARRPRQAPARDRAPASSPTATCDSVTGSICPSDNGPVGAVVFGHGSGQQTKDSCRFLADGFLSRGLATLCFDKRGVGQSTGTFVFVGANDSIPVFDDLASRHGGRRRVPANAARDRSEAHRPRGREPGRMDRAVP